MGLGERRDGQMATGKPRGKGRQCPLDPDDAIAIWESARGRSGAKLEVVYRSCRAQGVSVGQETSSPDYIRTWAASLRRPHPQRRRSKAVVDVADAKRGLRARRNFTEHCASTGHDNLRRSEPLSPSGSVENCTTFIPCCNTESYADSATILLSKSPSVADGGKGSPLRNLSETVGISSNSGWVRLSFNNPSRVLSL